MFRWHNWFSQRRATARKRSFRKSSSPTIRVRPQLEMLEDRLTPSVTVTTTLDPTTPVAGQVSLREAINMVNAGQVADNTIILPAGTYQNMQGALDVTHSLILQGTGAGTTIIDGGGNRQVIDISPNAAVNVQISGVTVRDGESGGFGGGIALEDSQGQSSTLTVMNSIITANKGGGIFANNGNILVDNSQITDNKGGFFGGIGDDNDGSSNITVIDSLIADNTASFAGAGISILNGGHGAVTITGSTLRDNTVTTDDFGGGGIFAQTTGDINIGNSTIEGNTSLNDGGGLEVLGFDGQTGGPANIVLSNDTITDNQSSQGNGGGIAIETASNVSLQNTTLNGNTAAEAGGGMFLNPNVLTAALQGSTVSGNTAGANGGGIEDQALTLTATNSTFNNNVASTGNGGGIDVEKGSNQTVNLTNVTLTGNQTKGSVGSSSGGGLFDSSAGSSVTLVSCLLADNTTATLGGGIEQTGGNLTVQTSQFTGNTAANNGGAVDFDAGTALTLSSSTFNNNRAGLSGGAVDDRADGTGSSLTNDTFTGNSAVGDGGAVAILSGPLALVNDTINDNTAGGNGGGVGDDSLGKQSFQNCIIAGNTAPAGNGPDVFTTIISTGSILTDLGGNFIGTLSGSFGFGAGTLTGNPLLGPLQNNGGIVAGAAGTQQVVQTEALLPGSPALGKGVPNSVTTDERGFNRISPPDIGAFQFQNASLSIAIAPAAPTVLVNGTETFTVTVTNTSGNALPADNSTLSVVLSNGLTTTDPLTFTLAAIPAGQSQTFTVTTTATTLGTQIITATVNSVDANPNTTSGSATIHVVVNTPPISPPPVTTHTPIGALTLFGIGFGPTGIDLFEIDGQGEVFAQAFGFGGTNGTPQFVAADAVFRNLSLMNGAIIADVLGGSGQPFLMEVLNFSDPFVFRGLLNALFGSRGL